MTNTTAALLEQVADDLGMAPDDSMSGELTKYHPAGHALVMVLDGPRVTLQIYVWSGPSGLEELDLRRHESYEVESYEDVRVVQDRLRILDELVLPNAHYI